MYVDSYCECCVEFISYLEFGYWLMYVDGYFECCVELVSYLDLTILANICWWLL
jgi:hypothetical protein